MMIKKNLKLRKAIISLIELFKAPSIAPLPEVLLCFIFIFSLFMAVLPHRLYAQFDSGSSLSELEPSDDYHPDGYYEPYDFSFVKTSPASETPAPTKYPLPPEAYGEQPFAGEQPDYTQQQQPAAQEGGYNDQVPGYVPGQEVPGQDSAAIEPADVDPASVPEPPDFSSLAVTPGGSEGAGPVVTDFSGVQNPFNEMGGPAGPPPSNNYGYGDNAGLNSGAPAGSYGRPPAEPVPGTAVSPAGVEAFKLFLRRGKRPVRYKVADAAIAGGIEGVISGKGLAEQTWEMFNAGLKKIYAGAISNTLSSAEPLDEEFERINSVLMTYMLSYGAPDFESVVIKYKNYYFAFLGPFSGAAAPAGFKPSNPEAKYKLLRLLGGDIIKIISGNTIMFSLKPLSFCVNDIMREVANGEFYKLEVLFRVMTSADAPVRNLVRPFFQLLKSRILSARDLEKTPELRVNYTRAFELLNKIK